MHNLIVYYFLPDPIRAKGNRRFSWDNTNKGENQPFIPVIKYLHFQDIQI